jgi:two-component system, chemotaxis family, CheB/CheR fusion protein
VRRPKAAKTHNAAPKNSQVAQRPGPKPDSVPVVGIGASAGGLEAIKELLRHLPEKSGLAYVFIQHLDPTHESVLEKILSRATSMPVAKVADGMAVERDHCYVIPANTNMNIAGGLLHLVARETARALHYPIDYFFHSLADDRGNQSIGVILSGAASDGTQGCIAIKAAGGITFAQDEKSAKYDSMPSSAILAGCIDFVLPPKGIARELDRIGRHSYIAAVPAESEETYLLAGRTEMSALLGMLRDATGVDFMNYKQSTLHRRIKRRMVVNRCDRLKDYLQCIRNDPTELDHLYHDILIHVTGFFRDRKTFDALREVILPAIFSGRKFGEGPLRIWVPGCSTGEEVYSLAIILLEYLWEQAGKRPADAIPAKGVQIFATDISDIALNRARNGVYAEAALAGVLPERLKRFFVRLDGGYQINKSIREMCVFAKQNIAKDPPFSNLDLVSCRNLLIYLGPLLQKRVIPTLHYALKPNGYLVLGESESLGSFSEHFVLVDKKHKIYQKKRTATRLATYFTPADYGVHRFDGGHAPQASLAGFTMDRDVESVLANRFVPASIVVNDAMEIVQFRGKTGAYLEPASGQPTFSLAKMARQGLLVDLRDLLIKAKKKSKPVRKQGVHIKSNGGLREINLEVIRLC